MSRKASNRAGYALAAFLGAIVGGVAVARATGAVPRIMREMMKGMATAMREGGCDPSAM